MVAMDLEAFRSHLLSSTDLLAIETSAIIEKRPRFAYSVLVLADRSSLPGEQLKANYIKQLDPLWIRKEVTKSPSADTLCNDNRTIAPCLVCREYGHSETCHFEEKQKQATFNWIKDENNNHSSISSFAPPVISSSNTGKSNVNTYSFKDSDQKDRTLSSQKHPLITPSKLRQNCCIEEVLTLSASKNNLQASNFLHQTEKTFQLGNDSFTYLIKHNKDRFAQHGSRNCQASPAFNEPSYHNLCIMRPRRPWFSTPIAADSAQHATNFLYFDEKNYQNVFSEETESSTFTQTKTNDVFSKRSEMAPVVKPHEHEFIQRYQKLEEWTDPLTLTNSHLSKNDNVWTKFPSTKETRGEVLKKVYHKSCCDCGMFPSEEREQYARWRANSGLTCLEHSSELLNVKIQKPEITPANMVIEKVANVTDPLINEAIRILEASCSMLNETARKLSSTNKHNQKLKESIGVSSTFVRNSFQSSSLRFPSERRRLQNANKSEHRRLLSGHKLEREKYLQKQPQLLYRSNVKYNDMIGDAALTTTITKTTQILKEKFQKK